MGHYFKLASKKIWSGIYTTNIADSSAFSLFSLVYTILIICSVQYARRITHLCGFDFPGGIFVFPMTYYIANLVTESWGINKAKVMVNRGVCAATVFFCLNEIINALPEPENWELGHSYSDVLGHSLQNLVGFLAGTFISERWNCGLLSKMKTKYHFDSLLLRMITATTFGELAFNCITYPITYLDIKTINEVFHLIINSWALKIIYGLFLLYPSLLISKKLKIFEKIEEL